MFTVMPWMFDLCKNNHRLTLLYAYIFDCCQGGQSFIVDNETKKDIWDYCRIDTILVDGLIADLVSLKALIPTELGYIVNI